MTQKAFDPKDFTGPAFGPSTPSPILDALKRIDPEVLKALGVILCALYVQEDKPKKSGGGKRKRPAKRRTKKAPNLGQCASISWAGTRCILPEVHPGSHRDGTSMTWGSGPARSSKKRAGKPKPTKKPRKKFRQCRSMHGYHRCIRPSEHTGRHKGTNYIWDQKKRKAKSK